MSRDRGNKTARDMPLLPQMLDAITTIHHDKPEGSRIAQMAKKQMKDNNDNNKEQQLVPFNVTKLSNERQKRLLPYINYYRNNYQPQQQQQQQNYEYLTTANHHGKFTPFLDSNAIPGPFIPMVKTNNYYDYEYETIQQPTRQQQKTPPNYSVIYDKLAQLKLIQQSHRYNIPRPQQQKPIQKNQNYIPIYNYGNQRYKILASLPPLPPPPTQSPLIKTIIHTYTPTQIDLTNNYYYKTQPNKDNIIYDFYQTNLSPQRFVGGGDDEKIKKPIIIIDDDRSIVTRPSKVVKPQVIVENNYVAQKYVQQPQEIEEEQIYYQTTPTNQPQEPTTKTNTLSVILKQLQDSNTLPHTLTPDNIDNSIRTLVKILNNLKKQQQPTKLTTKPIIVPEIVVDDDKDDDIYNKNKDEIVPGTIIQQFPANTIDGGTPGRPGIDYPALSTIPQTDFNCKLQRYKGFFADIKTNCQVWHYCDLNGGQASFLCPNGTIFSQVALTCDWWYNVKCSSTPQLYVLNERLYKYILPYSPKFPEDYSGPLVDKYLALKFQEMEEKMKKERKGKPKKDEEKQADKTEDDKDDSDQLRELQAKQIEET